VFTEDKHSTSPCLSGIRRYKDGKGYKHVDSLRINLFPNNCYRIRSYCFSLKNSITAILEELEYFEQKNEDEKHEVHDEGSKDNSKI